MAESGKSLVNTVELGRAIRRKREFQFLHAPTLPMHRLEQSVECFPDVVAHFTLNFPLRPQSLKRSVSSVKQCTMRRILLQA